MYNLTNTIQFISAERYVISDIVQITQANNNRYWLVAGITDLPNGSQQLDLQGYNGNRKERRKQFADMKRNKRKQE